MRLKSVMLSQIIKQTPIQNTVHKDITERLYEINPTLAENVHNVLNQNKAERHIRGGLATREKYLKLHSEK
ncbi:MAG: sporulation transcriptional regulator SpoIIID [Clostridia bacterium]|nr:sporulation transcriptional regulator SpoIIID [Clostridia bacterium]